MIISFLFLSLYASVLMIIFIPLSCVTNALCIAVIEVVLAIMGLYYFIMKQVEHDFDREHLVRHLIFYAIKQILILVGGTILYNLFII